MNGVESFVDRIAKIEKGWHKWFAWRPVRLINEDRTFAWLETVEVKYYATNGTRVVKKDLNTGKLNSSYTLKKMYRALGTNGERRVYIRWDGTVYVDPDEIIFSNESF
jgi:hypothetical protein